MIRRIVKTFWLIIGLIFTGIAFLGVVLPLLPTTPFLLLAAFCFARSSKTLHRWLYGHKWFGPLLVNWRDYGAIGPRSKIFAAIALIMTPVISFLLGAKPYVIAIQLPFLLGSAIFIMTRPNGPPPHQQRPGGH